MSQVCVCAVLFNIILCRHPTLTNISHDAEQERKREKRSVKAKIKIIKHLLSMDTNKNIYNVSTPMCWENSLILLLGAHKTYTRELEQQREQWSTFFTLCVFLPGCSTSVSEINCKLGIKLQGKILFKGQKHCR